MLALDVDTPLDQAVGCILRTGHSRAPSLKKQWTYPGLLYAKDFIAGVAEVIHPARYEIYWSAYFVPEAKRVDEL